MLPADVFNWLVWDVFNWLVWDVFNWLVWDEGINNIRELPQMR